MVRVPNTTSGGAEQDDSLLIYEIDEEKQDWRMSKLVGIMHSLLEQGYIIDFAIRKSNFSTVVDRFVQCQETNLDEIGESSTLHKKVAQFRGRFMKQISPYS